MFVTQCIGRYFWDQTRKVNEWQLLQGGIHYPKCQGKAKSVRFFCWILRMDPISFGNGYKRANVTLSLDIFSRVEYII